MNLLMASGSSQPLQQAQTECKAVSAQPEPGLNVCQTSMHCSGFQLYTCSCAEPRLYASDQSGDCMRLGSILQVFLCEVSVLKRAAVCILKASHDWNLCRHVGDPTAISVAG